MAIVQYIVDLPICDFHRRLRQQSYELEYL